MSTASLSSLPKTSTPHPHSHPLPTKSFPRSFNFKHPSFPSLKSNPHPALLTTPSSTLTSAPTTASSFDLLASHLAASDFRQADEETRRLLIVLAGENAVKRGYVFFSEVRFIDKRDLQEIDSLWKRYSDGRFGYSVQKRIWEKKAKRDFTNFFIKVGWMMKLETEVEQWNYRSFPGEFVWEMKEDTPEGHLPLTNALRGTQLLMSIFMHPAFEEEEGEEMAEEVGGSGEGKEWVRLGGGSRNFKTDYSF